MSTIAYSENFGDGLLTGWVITNVDGGSTVNDNGRMKCAVYKCQDTKAVKTIGTFTKGDKLKFDYQSYAEKWYESSYGIARVNGVSYNLGIPNGYKINQSGTIEFILPESGSLELEFGVVRSSYCSNSDHGWTILWIDNITVESVVIKDPEFNNTPVAWSASGEYDGGAAVTEGQGRMWVSGGPGNPVDAGSYGQLSQVISVPSDFKFSFQYWHYDPWGWGAFRAQVYIDGNLLWEQTPASWEQSGTATIDLSLYTGARTLTFKFRYIAGKQWPYWNDQAYFRIDNIVEISCGLPTCSLVVM